jgi:hypothetical protein
MKIRVPALSCCGIGNKPSCCVARQAFVTPQHGYTRALLQPEETGDIVKLNLVFHTLLPRQKRRRDRALYNDLL